MDMDKDRQAGRQIARQMDGWTCERGDAATWGEVR